MSSNEITMTTLLPTVRSGKLAQNNTYVGIDFGTSTTVVSIASFDNEGRAIHTKVLRLKQILPDGAVYSSEIVPTAIGWVGRILVGEGASQLKYQLKRGKNIWYSYKMELGEDLGAKYYESELREVAPFNIRNPKDAARVFFAYLKYLILSYCEENGLSQQIDYSVSIPASFEANQRKDLLDSLAANEMKVATQALIDEPNAAFISYAVQRATEGQPMFLHPDYNSKVMVFDFGGGTCDISLLEIGQDNAGFFSKNIAISKFTQLGGDDVDRYLVYHYLMPRFLEANGKSVQDFRTQERRIIANALMKVAERLKIRINKSIAVLVSNFTLPGVKDSDVKTQLTEQITVVTNKGTLSQSEFYLTNKELAETMAIFIKQGGFKTTKVNGENEYHSIFLPIESALKKANVNREEVDYVLFIGGSAQSPFVQTALHDYFEDAEMLVPVNLQNHVSQGAAIHSLLYNGMGKSLIQPISSEPILVITKGERAKVLMPAGIQIPCEPVVVSELCTSREGQQTIELPICVGNTSKMLFNLEISAPRSSGFPLNAPISLELSINADKMLLVKANCLGQVCEVTPMNPFANKELTTEEREALKAERQANLEAEENGGIPSKSTLLKLKNAYERIDKNFKAAETAEQINELYPHTLTNNYIGVLYHNAGHREKAIGFYERDIQENPNDPHAYFNLAHNIYHNDRQRAKSYLEKALQLDPGYEVAHLLSGRIDDLEGREEEALQKKRKALELFKQQWKEKRLGSWAWSWMVPLANELGEHALAKEFNDTRPTTEWDKGYNADNLAQSSNNMITIN